jgi:signal peptide peptidase SppA
MVKIALLVDDATTAYQCAMPEGPMAEHLRQTAARVVAAVRPMVPKRWRRDLPVVPVVRLTGVIGMATPLRPGLSLGGLAKTLDRAFGFRNAKAVALAINSPGGSPVQSHLIFRRIRALAEEKAIPVIGFVEDVAASGGYMLACAADEIVCDPASIVGSIGVIGATFGFPEAMKKLGVERRIYTAGEHKSTLDPFLPENEEDVRRLKAIQQDIHDMFIDLVRERRGARLTGPEKTMFSGEYWVAKTAKEFGLADQLGDLRGILRERYGKDVVTPLIGSERSLFGRRTPGVSAMAPERILEHVMEVRWDHPSMIEDIMSAIESRAIWARFGL